MESLIGKNVKVNFDFPLDNEVFEITGETKTEVQVTGDFSAGTHNLSQSQWIKKNLIKEYI
jgi:hypothetical protein